MKRSALHHRRDFTHSLARPNWWLPVWLLAFAVMFVVFMLWARSAATQPKHRQGDLYSSSLPWVATPVLKACDCAERYTAQPSTASA